MIKVEKCPTCKRDSLQVLKKQQFILPKIREYDELIDDVTYRYERLWIFFDKIWKSKAPAEFEATLCTSCGLIFTNPRFTEQEIRTKYNTVGELESAKKRTQKLPPLRTDERAQRIYSLIDGLQKDKSKLRTVLDYGGAKGYNLLPFVEAGILSYLTDYVKQDYPKGIECIGKDIGDLKTDDLFDVILFCHTLEHVVEPQLIVNDLSSHLTEGGLLYVEVPLGCWREWENLQEPLTHINFFSEESVFKCLRSAGLDVIYLSTAYQWVTHGENRCINIVASNRKGNTVTKFKTTQQQMKNTWKQKIALYYSYLKILLNDPRYFSKKLKQKMSTS